MYIGTPIIVILRPLIGLCYIVANKFLGIHHKSYPSVSSYSVRDYYTSQLLSDLSMHTLSNYYNSEPRIITGCLSFLALNFNSFIQDFSILRLLCSSDKRLINDCLLVTSNNNMAPSADSKILYKHNILLLCRASL